MNQHKCSGMKFSISDLVLVIHSLLCHVKYFVKTLLRNIIHKCRFTSTVLPDLNYWFIQKIYQLKLESMGFVEQCEPIND